MVIQVIKRKKALVSREECVACGACIKVCPVNAITIYKGIFAKVDTAGCIGCTKCANTCPAHAISMEVEE